MRSQVSRLARVLSCAATFCLWDSFAGAQAVRLGDLARAAKTQFRPVTAADVEAVKVRLNATVARLGQRLLVDGPNGADWRKFVGLDRLEEQLRRGRPDLAPLGEVYQRLNSGHEGLGLNWFADVREELRHYLELSGAVGNAQLKTVYEQMLDGLARQLDEYSAQPTTDGATAVEESLRWLENALQAPDVVRAVRDRLVYPNLLAAISAGTVAAGINEEVNETMPICDSIIGAMVSGTGCSTGQINGELPQAPGFGVVDATYLGYTRSNTVASRGPARVYSQGLTGIGTRKRLWADENGVFSLPAASNATTSTTITDIELTRGGRMLERIAWKKACQQQPQAESVAARHAEGLANQRADQRAAGQIAEANANFQKKLRQPLLERHLFPRLCQFNTDPAAIRLTAIEADDAQLGAPTAPIPLVESADLGLQVHETMANNLASGALRGMTVHETTFQSVLVDLLGKVPDRLKPAQDKEPVSIAFARRQPICVAFSDNTIRATMHGRRFFKGEESYPGMDVTVVYKVFKADRGFKLVRQGDIHIVPPGYKPGEGLSPKQNIIQTLLRRRFEKIFDKEILAQEFTLSGNWAKVGKFEPIQVVAHAGWLALAWHRVPNAQPVAASR